MELFLECAFEASPALLGVLDRSEFTVDYSLQLTTVTCLFAHPAKNMFLSHVACPFVYVYYVYFTH